MACSLETGYTVSAATAGDSALAQAVALLLWDRKVVMSCLKGYKCCNSGPK